MSARKVTDISFKVALSFPGERRTYVSEVVEHLRPYLGKDEIFYDFDYQAQLARPNLGKLIQRIYSEQSNLIVVFISTEYINKQWCGLEWGAICEIIKEKSEEKIMIIRFDDSPVEGLLPFDGYIDARVFDPKELASLILDRLSIM
jgi:hypothetical protein